MRFLYSKRVIIILILLTGFQKFYGFDATSVIKEGNELYKNGQFSQAAAKYQTIVDSGYIAADLFFNLANAYFKAKDIKSAILYYEKAHLLKPGDKELNYNLSLARTKVVDKIESIPDIFFIEWIRTFRDKYAVDSWAALSIIFFILGLGALLIYYFVFNLFIRKIGFWLGSVFIIISLISITFASSAYNSQTRQRTAIIFVKAVTIKSTPSETGTNLFILHEGTKVRIIDKVDNWHKIKIPDGNQGWIKESDIAKI